MPDDGGGRIPRAGRGVRKPVRYGGQIANVLLEMEYDGRIMESSAAK